MNELKNQRVFITGAASGIGRATAETFYQAGYHLVLMDIPSLEESELEHHFVERMEYIQGDISSPSVQEKIESAMEKGVHTLINNAGITRDATALKMTKEAWDSVIQINLTAVFELSQMAAKKMKEQGHGNIINAASVVAHYGNFGQANYVATKAGVIGLTKTMAKELGKYGVRVNAVAPGFIGTPMVQKMPEKVLSMMNDKASLKRMGTPKEIADAYAFLASEKASFITGTTLNVDGGLILG